MLATAKGDRNKCGLISSKISLFPAYYDVKNKIWSRIRLDKNNSYSKSRNCLYNSENIKVLKIFLRKKLQAWHKLEQRVNWNRLVLCKKSVFSPIFLYIMTNTLSWCLENLKTLTGEKLSRKQMIHKSNSAGVDRSEKQPNLNGKVVSFSR